ncbi:MAG TPA: sterol desaturase family protein [Aquabacterium sp.]|uniref:sterol desaturase family protein n=1 Tax=Aquabacterium sp. TaxID=1872578 RepID=UPI002E3003E8|nr:sterol desaturase family protein [Aquabacterium sp.]HEX5356409.1 sterol desaturase family protein [Aquabacterium sp.]
MTPDAVQAFRQRYRAQVSPHYSALLHAAFVFGLGLTAYGALLSQVQQALPWQWLAAPLGLLVFNAAVYLVHRELGHHKRSWAALFYARHTGDHHSFFSEREMSYDSWLDWRVILFPPWLIVVYLAAFVAPSVWIISALVDANTGWIFGAHATMGYLLYEFFHTCHHLPDGHWLTNLPWLREMRQLHRLHHRRDLMHTHNFNIVLPLMDKVCGTLHWEAPSR